MKIRRYVLRTSGRRRHYFHAEILPLIQNRVICLHCEKVVAIGNWPTGKRRKCLGTTTRPAKGKRAVSYEQALAWGHRKGGAL